MRIGASFGGTTRADIDEIEFYDRALTAQEIQDIHASGGVSGGASAGLFVPGTNEIIVEVHNIPVPSGDLGCFAMVMDLEVDGNGVQVLSDADWKRSSVGRQGTVPAGAPPTGSAGDETLIATLISLGDRIDSNRHCDLAAAALSGGRMRRWHLHDANGC